MSEKTEKATPKKRRDARQEGNVLRSEDLTMAISMLVLFWTLQALIGYFPERAFPMTQRYLSGEYIKQGLDAFSVGNALLDAMIDFLIMLAPIMLVAMVVGIALSVIQTGFLFTPKAIMPKMSKINPLSGFKRMFSVTALFNLAKSILKVVLVAAVLYQDALTMMLSYTEFVRTNIGEAIRIVAEDCISLGIKAAMVYLVIGVFDYMYSYWKYEKDLMMTKQEVKDEYKNQEGDPKIKGKIKQKQREIAQMRMMQSVPDADVVITNPTHFAVAVVYDGQKYAAPLMLAKGADNLARRIREVAEKNDVPVVENPELCRAIYYLCDIGDFIPEHLYHAVAEVLAFVYRMQGRAG